MQAEGTFQASRRVNLFWAPSVSSQGRSRRRGQLGWGWVGSQSGPGSVICLASHGESASGTQYALKDWGCSTHC